MNQSQDHFREHGWMIVRGGIPAARVEGMRQDLWRALAELGIDRAQPETWTVERPTGLQRLRHNVAFRWCPSDELEQAIREIAGPDFEPPSDWGSAFIAFPSQTRWGVPHSGWHIDANYRSSLSPAQGVKTLALLEDVETRGGGTQMLSCSHRLVHNWFQKNPPPPAARSAELRALLRGHPYIEALLGAGDAAEDRIARFTSITIDEDGLSLRVVEATGSAGDVVLMHPLLLHAAAPNNNATPRLMISGGITTNMWGWV